MKYWPMAWELGWLHFYYVYKHKLHFQDIYDFHKIIFTIKDILHRLMNVCLQDHYNSPHTSIYIVLSVMSSCLYDKVYGDYSMWNVRTNINQRNMLIAVPSCWKPCPHVDNCAQCSQLCPYVDSSSPTLTVIHSCWQLCHDVERCSLMLRFAFLLTAMTSHWQLCPNIGS